MIAIMIYVAIIFVVLLPICFCIFTRPAMVYLLLVAIAVTISDGNVSEVYSNCLACRSRY